MIGAGHAIIFLPKFHCEFNWIERYWGCAKSCDYSFKGLCDNVPLALEFVSLTTMRKFARKSYRYIDAYRSKDGVELSAEMAEWNVKKYTSHRRILKFETTKD